MLFSEVGEVNDIHLPFDKVTGRPRGFGFIEMPDDAAKAAIERFHGTEFGGRTLTVNEAQPRAERPQGERGDRPRFERGGDRPRFERRDDRNFAPRHEEAPALQVEEGGMAEEAPAAPADEAADMDEAA
jgi:cold-inducible RNA-binding protein